MKQATLRFGAGNTPLVVSYGRGVDSTAALVGLARLGIRPDLILFADTGSEKQATYDYASVIDPWLALHGFPPVTTVRYQPKNFKHWPHYHSLEENLLTNITLPSIAYGRHSCSIKWKIAPMNAYVKAWQPARDAWAAGRKVRKIIGYDDGRRDRKRCSTFQATENSGDLEMFDFWYVLQEWGWNRERCIEEIVAEGLPVPPKSSCYFCTAMQPWEVRELPREKLQRIVIIEARIAARNADRLAAGLSVTAGLWRGEVKGFRGSAPHPERMTDFIRAERLLPSDEIDRIIAATPTHYIYDGEIESWQHFLTGIQNAPDYAN